MHVKSEYVKAGLRSAALRNSVITPVTSVVRAMLGPGLMVAVLTTVASAGPFEDAAAAYRQGDYPTHCELFARWRKRALP